MQFSDLSNWAKKHKLHVYVVVLSRTVLACTFFLSALIKANDPVGMAIKLQEYATAVGLGRWNDLLLVGVSIALALVESALAISLAFGLNRRLSALMTAFFMTVMTALTVWLAVENPIEDCGCFGDVIILTNTQTLLKNVLLLFFSLTLVRWYRLQHRFVPSEYSWLLSFPLWLGFGVFAVWNVIHLPFMDFRPYYVGADLRTAWEQQTGRPQFDVKIIYQRGNEIKELQADDPDLDSTWHYVETRSVPISATATAGMTTYLSHRKDVADFNLTDSDGNDRTDDILHDSGYVFLLIAPNLATADQGCVGNVNLMYEDAVARHASFYCLTASDRRLQDYWTDHTGAEYTYLQADGQLLRTMVRANPGLVLLHDGKIIAKWSNWNMPAAWNK